MRRTALLVLAACGSEAAAPVDTECADAEIVVTASDYQTSALCVAPECDAHLRTGVDLGRDPILASSNGRTFFVARDTDRIFELGACGAPRPPVDLHAFAPADRNANPHDVAAAPDGTLVVPLYHAAKVAFVKDGAVESLDLASYDADENPEADAVSVVTVDGAAKAFVTLERLTATRIDGRPALVSQQPSQMLRIDVATRAVEAVIELAGRNPFNPMPILDGRLFLSAAGSFDSVTDEAAGIERFDTATSTTRLLVREADLGGSVLQLAVTRGCGAAIVAGPEPDVNPTSVVTFDPETGAVLDRVLGPTPGFDLSGVTWRGDALYVGDRRRASNGFPVHVFARTGSDCKLTPADRTIAVPLPPIGLRGLR